MMTNLSVPGAVTYVGDESTLAQLRKRLARLEAVHAELEDLHLPELAAQVISRALTLRFCKVRGPSFCLACNSKHEAEVSVGSGDSLVFQPCGTCG